jgi:hypothetical protein
MVPRQTKQEIGSEQRHPRIYELNAVTAGGKVAVTKGSGLFEVEDYSFDIEQVLNIGSQSSGGGAGK